MHDAVDHHGVDPVGGCASDGRGGMILIAAFDEIGGLSVRAPVVISGVKVGQVTRIALDRDLRARVMMDVDADLQLSIDTSAAIRTSLASCDVTSSEPLSGRSPSPM